MIKPFYCPDCEQTLDLPFVPNRKRCPNCATAHAKKRDEEKSKRNREIYKERTKLKNENQQKTEKKPPELTAMQKMDAELNARTALQLKQCRKCEYFRKELGNYEYCDFISWTGHITEKGNGPGDCRSFLKRGTKGKAERMARRKLALARSEADHAYGG